MIRDPAAGVNARALPPPDPTAFDRRPVLADDRPQAARGNPRRVVRR